MEITEVRITLRNEDKLKAFANVTFDGEFVIRGLKVINGNKGYFVSMPSRKRSDGTHQDIAHPINNAMRKKIEDKVLASYEQELKTQTVESPRAPENPVSEAVPTPAESIEGAESGEDTP